MDELITHEEKTEVENGSINNRRLHKRKASDNHFALVNISQAPFWKENKENIGLAFPLVLAEDNG